MASLISATPSDLQHLVALFSEAMDASTLDGGTNWTLTPAVAGAMPAVVTNATLRANGLVVDLIVGAALTAGINYTLMAPNAKTALGAALLPLDKQVVFLSPAVNGDTSEWPGRILEAATRATAEEIQTLAGRAWTQLVADFGEDDAVAFVETTLGFPDYGAFYAGKRKYTYTSRTDCSFLGCQKVRDWDGTALSAWTPVVNDPSAWYPVE